MSRLHRVSVLDLRIVDVQWSFANERRTEIDAHFASVMSGNASLWNGRVLLCRNPRIDNGIYRAEYFETDFASFLAWRDWGFPDKTVFNSFGAGALRSADGAYVLGRMSAHTANAGRVYFPAGTPDLHDVVGDRLDLAGSVARETEEEVGLTPDDYIASDVWTIIETGQVVACLRPLTAHLALVPLRQRIEAFLAAQRKSELDRIVTVRNLDGLTESMPEFVKVFVRSELQGDGEST